MKFTLPELRDMKKLTQRQLASELSSIEKGLNFSPSAIALYELGLRTPNLRRAKVIARYFGVSIESIIFGHDAFESKAKVTPTGTEGN